MTETEGTESLPGAGQAMNMRTFRNVEVGGPSNPANEDWLRTMGWSFPTTLAEFRRAIAPDRLAHFMTLSKARAMPAKLCAEVKKVIAGEK